MRRRTLVVAGALALALGATLWWRWRTGAGRGPVGGSAWSAPVMPRVVPVGTRVRVEVLNTSNVRGLARRATEYLRDLGFDVVHYATEGPARDSTLVLDRTGHPEWALMVSKSLGGAPVESRPDTSRYVDVSVLIGRTWRPPPQPFYP